MSSEDKKAIIAKGSDSTEVSPYTLTSGDNPGSMISSVQLTGENYAEWATEMLNAFKAKRKTGFVDGSIIKPMTAGSEMESWTSVNSMVVGWLRTSITPRVRSTVSFVSDAAELWENLKERFSVGNKVRVHQIVCQLASCRQEGQSVIDYYGRLVVLWDELQGYRPIPLCTCGAATQIAKEREDKKVHQFVMGLDESRFGNMICQIIDAEPMPDLAQAYAKVIREEQRLAASKRREQKHEVVGFTTRSVPQAESPVAFNGHETSEASSYATRSVPAKFNQINNRNRERSLCSHCGRSGHEKDYCWELIGYPEWWNERSGRGRGHGSGRGGQSSSFQAAGRGRGYVTVAHATSPHASAYPSLTPKQWKALEKLAKEKRFNTSDKLSGKINEDIILDTWASHHMTGNLALLTNVGSMSSCKIGFTDGSTTMSSSMGVIHVSDNITLENVLYVPTLDCTLISDRFSRMLIGRGEERDGVYYLKNKDVVRVNKVELQRDSTLWHRRLGHPSSIVISSLPMFSDSKNSASSTPCDVCLWTYLLLEKSEVWKVLQNFCVYTKKQFGKDVRMVRSNNGTEFMCLSTYFRENGIIHQTSCVDTPQQNGCVERKHRHILNVARSLLFQASLPIIFWGEAILTAAYLINKTPTKVLHGKTPYELLFNKKSSYDELKVFGSACSTHRKLRDKDKFGPRSRSCIFVGYPFGKKGWKVYDLEDNEFLVSRDVVFHEDVFLYATNRTLLEEDTLTSPTRVDDDWVLTPESTSILRGSPDDDSPSDPPVEITTPSVASENTTPLVASENTTLSVVEENVDTEPSSPVIVKEEESPIVDLHTSPEPPEELGVGKRMKYPSVRLHGYVTYNAHCLEDSHHAPSDYDTASSTPVQGKTPYPLTNYISDDNFSTAHQVFLAALVEAIEPTSYKQAIQDPRWTNAMGT
ncbi:PREDICTED: uncharacterized protein LOC109133252 [Camelina sativa]|uniref:Uncharacterized protein LOC109133252 n=1 Tax=Camelina sativa TaxID=90675 RepID=A0ABM1RRZ1_CAMSA|nr:PREDICTED: uncharacterized protein LOC109133252 [Camelina sativa]